MQQILQDIKVAGFSFVNYRFSPHKIPNFMAYKRAILKFEILFFRNICKYGYIL